MVERCLLEVEAPLSGALLASKPIYWYVCVHFFGPNRHICMFHMNALLVD